MAYLDSLATAISGEPLKIVLVTIPGWIAALAKETIDRLEKRAVAAKPEPHYKSDLEQKLRAEITTVNRWRLSSYALTLVHPILVVFVLPTAKAGAVTWGGLDGVQKTVAGLLVLGTLWLLVGGAVVVRAAWRMRLGGWLSPRKGGQ